jgi:hypothetical protein
VVHLSAIAPAEVTLLNDSKNNEQLFINLATVMGKRISIIPPAQSCTVSGNKSDSLEVVILNLRS